MLTPRRATGALLFVLSLLFTRGAAAADDPPPHAAEASGPSASLTLGLFAGFENGLSLAVASPGRSLVAEVSQSFLLRNRLWSVSEVSLTARTAPVGPWLGGRAGYQLASFKYEGAAERDVVQAFDLGIVLGATSQRGHVISLEAGAERVWRDAIFVCCDGVADKTSYGARVMLAGQLALGPRAGLFTRLGVRTGHHLLEIHLLPVFQLGVAVTF